MIELLQNEKERIFNLGYYTWVEQQGIKIEDFEIRRHQSFWDNHMKNLLKLVFQKILKKDYFLKAIQLQQKKRDLLTEVPGTPI